MLYFPTGLGFGKLKALPAPEEVEYPERDLADLLVSLTFLPPQIAVLMTRPIRTGILTEQFLPIGSGIF
jgi:hypothetical protein